MQPGVHHCCLLIRTCLLCVPRPGREAEVSAAEYRVAERAAALQAEASRLEAEGERLEAEGERLEALSEQLERERAGLRVRAQGRLGRQPL